MKFILESPDVTELSVFLVDQTFDSDSCLVFLAHFRVANLLSILLGQELVGIDW